MSNKLPAGGEEGVIISGRLPVWAFSALIHFWRDLGYEPVVTTYHPELVLTLVNFVT